MPPAAHTVEQDISTITSRVLRILTSIGKLLRLIRKVVLTVTVRSLLPSDTNSVLDRMRKATSRGCAIRRTSNETDVNQQRAKDVESSYCASLSSTRATTCRSALTTALSAIIHLSITIKCLSTACNCAAPGVQSQLSSAITKPSIEQTRSCFVRNAT